MQISTDLARTSTATAAPVAQVKEATPWDRVYAGEPHLLRLVIRRDPDDHGPSLPILAVHCDDPNVEVQTDLLQRDVRIAPGETLRLTLPVRFRRPGTIRMSRFAVQVGEFTAKLRLGRMHLTIRVDELIHRLHELLLVVLVETLEDLEAAKLELGVNERVLGLAFSHCLREEVLHLKVDCLEHFQKVRRVLLR